MNLAFEAGAGLRLQLPDLAGDALDAALALAAHEPLVAALEAWLQQPLDLRPASGDAPDSLVWADAGPVAVGLSWPLLAAAAPPPPELAWPELACEVDVAGFDRAPPLGTAGLLLLPAAFETPWRVALHAAGRVVDAEWRGPGSELALCGPPEPASAPRAAWRVQLADAVRRPLPQWLGWQPMAPIAPGAKARLVGPEGPLAEGRIAPALSGFGLLI